MVRCDLLPPVQVDTSVKLLLQVKVNGRQVVCLQTSNPPILLLHVSPQHSISVILEVFYAVYSTLFTQLTTNNVPTMLARGGYNDLSQLVDNCQIKYM